MSAVPFVIEIAIEPRSRADCEKLDLALRKLVAEDSSVGVSTDQESGQAILKGMSEEQLDVAVGRLRRDNEIDLYIGQPQVSYREKLRKKVEITYIHKKQAGAAGQFAKVTIIFEPAGEGAGSSFESKIVDGAVPEEYIPGVRKGIDSVMGSGVLAGFPVVDVKATLTDGAYHDVDSSVLAFEIAARSAFREALQKGGSVLLEPIMKVEVVTPLGYAGFVINNLKSRGGQLLGQDTRVGAVVVDATAPLASMFGYVNSLRAGTAGRASFAMSFSHYAPVPPSSPDDDLFPPAVGMRA